MNCGGFKIVSLVLFLIMSTSVSLEESDGRNMHKVKFDMSTINDEGLIGPPNGLRSFSYEFCIPSSDDALTQVWSIDSSIQHYQSSHGRIKCPVDMHLCIAETFNENRPTLSNNNIPTWKDVLKRLSDLEFIDCFVQSFGE